ncbi:hypothetical protein PAECIP111893_00300 [Paenibacillus plantiphilus]|uniref:HTH cro/C1-type domain-containing protein n=1 Tax=Paenibacillus plantiphilus TaxID=2905650 RepID=A0ABN8FX79_9BACL|nr:helix-turn-helix transcriptional regulator [Paenibacillus plantiphilus]CAH1190374.1 hypothetical protein PAECIP111893_00300 [Paenibacillus plantiphilus]
MNPNVLEKYRIKKGLNCSQLCECMGKTAGWYSRIRSGRHPLRTEHISKMALIFGVRPEKLAKEYFSKEKLDDTSI